MCKRKKKCRGAGPVIIRFKPLANGGRSIYLDKYWKGVRSYEFLHLYLVPERTAEDKKANDAVIIAAQVIRAQRIKDMLTQNKGIKKLPGDDIPLLDWMMKRQEQSAQLATLSGHKTSTSSASIHSAICHLIRYIKERYPCEPILLTDVNKDFCAGFMSYLMNHSQNGKKLSINSCILYYSKLSAALNEAQKKGLILTNPANSLDRSERPGLQQTERAYLTINEIRSLSKAYCSNEQVKSAFLFSCMCGLRWSDIKALTWGKVNDCAVPWQVEIRMLKTRKVLYLPLSAEAIKFIPRRGNSKRDDSIFILPSLNSANSCVRKWTDRAGIEKHITFHCARHTFATLMLTLGADIYTTSKLLGHSDIKTTQIYAVIIDKKKQDAVNLTSGLFD